MEESVLGHIIIFSFICLVLYISTIIKGDK